MYKSLSKLLIMMTILVAFVGQAMASHFLTFDDANVNQQVNIQQQSAVEFDKNNDAKATADTSNDVDDCCDTDCCEGECFCPANACVSMVYLNNSLDQSSLILINEFALATTQKNPQNIVSSLYRPPIFTS